MIAQIYFLLFHKLLSTSDDYFFFAVNRLKDMYIMYSKSSLIRLHLTQISDTVLANPVTFNPDIGYCFIYFYQNLCH
jgi:hypothetical protein